MAAAPPPPAVAAPAPSPLARPELAPLVDALARRFGEGDEPVRLSLRALPTSARNALADLLGLDRTPRPDQALRVAQLVHALGLRSVAELRTTVEAVRGPLPDRRGARAADRQARDELWSWFAAQAAQLTLGPPEARAAWAERVRSQGVRDGVARHRRRLDDALRVLRALPADGVALAAFAHDLLGAPHALDRGRRVAAMVLDGIALASGQPLARDAEAARQLWEAVGVAPDPLSSTVLALGLPAEGAPPPLGPWLAAAAAASEPVVLTLAQLRRWPQPPLPADATAYVVENPSLVAEAARQGWRGPPLVCSSGRPTVAVLTLVRQLGAAGATLYQHADFDPAGIGITAWLAERAGTVPWRMTSAHYRAAVADGHEAEVHGAVPATPWDSPLADALRVMRRPVFEEELRADLLDAMQSGE